MAHWLRRLLLPCCLLGTRESWKKEDGTENSEGPIQPMGPARSNGQSLQNPTRTICCGLRQVGTCTRYVCGVMWAVVCLQMIRLPQGELRWAEGIGSSSRRRAARLGHRNSKSYYYIKVKFSNSIGDEPHLWAPPDSSATTPAFRVGGREVKRSVLEH